MITVIGYDGSPLSSEATAALAEAPLVVGGARHLAAAEVQGVALGDVRDGVARLVEQGGVLLASGDPGLFGPLRLVRSSGADATVVPALSSVQVAFARAGLPWDDAVVVSAHGRDPRQALNACRAHGKVAVLTGPGCGAREIGAALEGWDRILVVASDLGTEQERVEHVCAAEAAARTWPELSVVLCVDQAKAVAPEQGWVSGRPGAGPWALPDTEFAHRDGMLTKAEVRALVLARLGPRLGELVWDVGCGSGSVAVECARHGAAVIAVDRADLGHVRANAQRFEVDVRVVEGEAPAALVGLPHPDAVFVGGGGPDVVAAVAAVRPVRVVVALATVERVAPTVAALEGYDVDTVLVQVSHLAPLGTGHRLVPANPVFVVSGVLP